MDAELLKEYQPTHEFLVARAAEWLTSRCYVVLTEMVAGMGGECPDAIGWGKRAGSILIEVKVSRSDFLADGHKPHRREPWRGMGDERFFCAPQGMIKPEEVPEGWGLLEWTGERMKKTHEGRGKPWRKRAVWKEGVAKEMEMLVTALRRVGQQTPKGISVRAYTYETKNRATLGVML